jgi:hypothetical protein
MMKKVTGVIRARKYRTAAAAVVIATVASVGFSTQTADAATAANPTDQVGLVHSCTTNGEAGVSSFDGGQTWFFDGSGGPGSPQVQIGVVHSSTTGGNANVATNDGGLVWIFDDNGGPLFCSAP